MDFQTAVRTVFVDKYADFKGRARRSEFWFAYLAYFIAAVILDIIGAVIHFRYLIVVLVLAVISPIWAMFARRMHDIGRSGWWWLIGLTGVGIIVLIVWLATDTKPGPNQYGPAPKEAYGPYGGGSDGWQPPAEPDNYS